MKEVRYRVGEGKDTSRVQVQGSVVPPILLVVHEHRVRTWGHQRDRIGHTSDRGGNSAAAVVGALEHLLGSEGVATLETASVVLT